ncbi:MAG: hypothetical protein Q9178_006690 [Gyalolechia marmorata]
MTSTPTPDLESPLEQTRLAKPAVLGPQDFPKIVKKLTETEEQPLGERLLEAEAYLSNSLLDPSIPENHVAANQLQDWTIKAISSTDEFAIEAPYAAEAKPVISSDDVGRLCSMKATGLQLLSLLQNLQPTRPDNSAAFVACLASFTDLEDPWTNENAFVLAQSMLSSHLQRVKGNPNQFDDLITDLLLHHVKPLFIKSKSPVLTDQGRKAIAPLPGNALPSDFESGNKPWKFQSPHIITIFRWILCQLDSIMVEKHWPLVIPPLLTILDDVSTTLKIRGCRLLRILLKVVPASLLERSGLGEVFHDTLMPYLLYLPTLTPEEESIPLLNATYDTLLSLTLARQTTPDTNPLKVTKPLDAIFRYGILKGHAHAGEKVRIAELLIKKSTDLVNAMGIHSVKHLKDLLPIISATLTAPFATAYPPLLDASVQLLRAIIVNGWPRLAFHRAEVLEGLIICWCRIEEEDKPTTALLAVREHIEDVLRAVVQLLRGDDQIKRELQMLRDCDSRLERILKV